jgi:hypothetical protein
MLCAKQICMLLHQELKHQNRSPKQARFIQICNIEHFLQFGKHEAKNAAGSPLHPILPIHLVCLYSRANEELCLILRFLA